ncbi:hypothetical protein WR25_02556 [Diploscapter pachys]|uniref:Uncharacterized protein n=1 Tax=Diploscapter pachys TaxID=2018661 RepID=A0A2A2KUB8_9BILA|nr:hypothetical protein WR25_02556 [Diploscapter pachys]
MKCNYFPLKSICRACANVLLIKSFKKLATIARGLLARFLEWLGSFRRQPSIQSALDLQKSVQQSIKATASLQSKSAPTSSQTSSSQPKAQTSPSQFSASPAFASVKAPPPQAPVQQSRPQSTPTPSTVLSQPQPTVRMHTSAAISNIAHRIPMIKFIGARLPRPHFDRSSLPPIPAATSTAAAIFQPSSSGAKATSIGSVGKLPRGSGVDESQLPLRFRRIPISQEEIDAINVVLFQAGGSYGLVTQQAKKK